MKKVVFIILSMWYLLSANTTFAFTHADTLRGSNGRGRDWWDVKKYELYMNLSCNDSLNITGINLISFVVLDNQCDSMQIDLQEPMILEGAAIISFVEVGYASDFEIKVVHDHNVWWLKYPFHKLKKGSMHQLLLHYHGIPKVAVNPPWDGGISYKTDSAGKPWIAVSCQGLGASAWWPCKDAQWDEPDSGMTTTICAPDYLVAISNGKLINREKDLHWSDTCWQWEVKNPINNYDVSFYVGDYVHWSDTVMGEKGKLDLDFWVLRYNEERARKQFAVVKQMIHCFEYWMGPYPFYEDGYKLVEAPYLGMEHQSAVAYGNKYKMGYMGYDRTGTDIGMKFDYIIIHESGHEWFGNNVTAKDMADNWIHEGITTYSESLFAECLLGKEKGQEYCRGEWRNVDNDKPMIGPYSVNKEGSNDIYDKGAAMMYMIRKLTNDDEKFRQMLRGLGKDFYHQTVTTEQVEKYISNHTGVDLVAFFNQYLRQTDIPVLEYKISHKKLTYKFIGAVKGFTLPIPVTDGKTTITINPSEIAQTIKWKGRSVVFSKDFLIKIKKGIK